MATTNVLDAETTTRNRAAVAVLAGLAVVGVVLLVIYLQTPPQMGTSEEVFNTVDALYTAVRNQDEKRLGECEQRLAGYRAAGKLPADAADALDSIIRRAKGGGWDSAAKRLYDFMIAQRREGELDHAPKPPKAKPRADKAKA